jgi:galactokinase/mevalonate kinase-like predicted kinase
MPALPGKTIRLRSDGDALAENERWSFLGAQASRLLFFLFRVRVSPMFVEASVPGRVNLFGNPLDIYGGLVMSSSVGLRARVSARLADKFVFVVGPVEFVVREAGDLASQGDRFDFLRALVRSMDAVPTCRIDAVTDIPIRSGLAGSAAYMVAASTCLLNLAGKAASLDDVLRAAHRAEVDFLGNFCGWNDFYACALGGAHSFCYRHPIDDTPDVRSLTLGGGEVSFAIALTGNRHVSGSVNGNLWARWREGDPVVRGEYGKLAELGASARDAFERHEWPMFGRLMWENFMCQHRLRAADEIEHRLVHTAMEHGAFGAKLSGAGYCGSVVVLARNEDHERVQRALEAVGVQRYLKVEPTEGLVVSRG